MSTVQPSSLFKIIKLSVHCLMQCMLKEKQITTSINILTDAETIVRQFTSINRNRTDNIIAGMDGRDELVVPAAEAVQREKNRSDAVVKHVSHQWNELFHRILGPRLYHLLCFLQSQTHLSFYQWQAQQPVWKSEKGSPGVHFRCTFSKVWRSIQHNNTTPLLRMRFSGTSLLGKQGQICFAEYLKIVNIFFA